MLRFERVCLLVLVVSGAAGGQEAPKAAKPAQFSGCVTALPDDATAYVLAGTNSCSLLSGKLADERLKGRMVTVTGDLSEMSATGPEVIAVRSVDRVGKACTQTCDLDTPGQRGLRRKSKAGAAGGTPGS